MASGSAASGVALNTGLVFSVNGARPNQSAYTLDGGLNMDAYNNVPAAFPNPDMLQEFSILQNSYSAVYGRDAGAVINMITKSGTNQIHGTAYDFLRNNYADAKRLFRDQGTSVETQPVWRHHRRTRSTSVLQRARSHLFLCWCGAHAADAGKHDLFHHCSHGPGKSR